MNAADHPTLAEQRERLHELRRWEGQLAALRDRRNALEAECIAGDVALRRSAGKRASIDAALAVEIEAALDRRQHIEEQLARARDDTKPERDRRTVARDALRLWLEAPRSERRPRAGGRIKHVLFALSMLVIIAALSVHLAFLVLLLPVAGASSFLSWSGQDDAWRKTGAKRRFMETCLEAPKRWEEDAVRQRLEEIEARIAAHAAREPAESEDDPGTIEATRDAERAALGVLLAGAGLDEGDLDPETETWIRALGRAGRSRRERDEVQAEIAGLRHDIDELREDLYRYLARRGATEGTGRADTDTLAAALERLARAGPAADPPPRRWDQDADCERGPS